jgi:putative membrane protein
MSVPFLIAHAGQPPQPHDLWTAWRFEAGITIPLLVSAALYLGGARRSRGVSPAQVWCFWSGWALLAVALVSPVHALGESLFSAHMVQHELLMLGAAPLLVLARPLAPWIWALPFRWRRTVGGWGGSKPVAAMWRILTSPAGAWCLHAAALWLWHIPGWFQATLANEWIHAAQHATFLGSALLFWWSVFFARGRSGFGSGIFSLFATAVHSSILGALLTFSNVVWYPAYTARAPAWGLTPLDDQRIGGLIMWVPAGTVYVIAALWMVSACLESRKDDRVTIG